MLSTVMTKGERGMILEDWRHMNMSYLKAMCMYNVMYIPEGCNHVKLSSRKYTLHVLHIIKCTSGGFSDCLRKTISSQAVKLVYLFAGCCGEA